MHIIRDGNSGKFPESRSQNTLLDRYIYINIFLDVLKNVMKIHRNSHDKNTVQAIEPSLSTRISSLKDFVAVRVSEKKTIALINSTDMIVMGVVTDYSSTNHVLQTDITSQIQFKGSMLLYEIAMRK